MIRTSGNFGVLPLKAIAGDRQMTFVNVDFDDAGRGPFVLDFCRYIIAVRTTNGRSQKARIARILSRGSCGQEHEASQEGPRAFGDGRGCL